MDKKKNCQTEWKKENGRGLPNYFQFGSQCLFVAEVMSAVLKRWGWNAADSISGNSVHSTRTAFCIHQKSISCIFFWHFSSPSNSKPVLAMLSYRRQLMAETLSSISCTEPSCPGRKWLSMWKSLSAFFPSTSLPSAFWDTTNPEYTGWTSSNIRGKNAHSRKLGSMMRKLGKEAAKGGKSNPVEDSSQGHRK